MIVNRTFYYTLLFPQGYSKSGVTEQSLYSVLSLDMNVEQATFAHLN